MQKAWGVVSLILTLCVLLYLVLWMNLFERFYSKTIIISALILSPHGNISLYKTEKPFHPTERELNITPIPVLYKKNFTKLPVWDFEDVYMQDSQPRKPTCPKSFQTTEDHEFKEAVLPDIQLWLYKGHLNITEWNRLAHFNNPFGFMEYNYNGRGNSHDHLKWDLVLHFFLFENPFQADISCKGRKGSQFPFHVDFKKNVKRAVDLIPKPKSSILLPVPEGAKDGCIRCAVVGCGGILNGSKMGKEIDSHDYVFRVNGAVTQGYEEDVGKRTSVYVHTAFSLYSNIHSLKKYGFNNIPQDEGIKYVMIPEGMRDFDWLQGLLQGKVANGSYKGVSPLKFFNGHFNESRFYVLHPDFLRYVRNRFMPSKQLQGIHWALFRPTNGAFALFLAMHTCDIVDAYGYITEDHDKYSNYYYEKLKKTRVIFYINHDYGLEIKTWKKLHDSGIIRLFQRH